MHGFVVVRDSFGKLIAVGDQLNMTRGDRVRSRLVIHFRDGSIDDERTVFTQGKFLRMVSDHHIQTGPSFKEPLDLEINLPSGTVKYHEVKDGKDEVKTKHMDLPPDLANGIMSPLLDNYPSKTTELKVSYLTGGSDPRVVHLSIKPGDTEFFHVGGSRRRAKRFNIHVEIQGIAGAVAPLIGKQPSDIKIWLMDGEVPTFLKMEGAFYQQGPIWTLQLASPIWPKNGQ